MTRKKVTLAYITNDSERKASFKKRKKGLIKKVSELSTLCDVEACAIIYSQYDASPEVWPSPTGAQAVLARFQRLSEMDQCRKMVNQESFTRQRIKKADDQFRRVAKENKRRDMENFLFQSLAGMVTLDDFDFRKAPDMSWIINLTLREISSRMSALKKSGRHLIQGSDSGSAPAAAESSVPTADVADGALVVVAPPMVEVMALPPPPPPPPPPAAAPVVDLPPMPAVEVPPLMDSEYVLESFPWDLLNSPSRTELGSGLYYNWDDPDPMVLPTYDKYKLNFDANNDFAATSPAFELPELGTGPDDLGNI